jgi:hypothetical protein
LELLGHYLLIASYFKYGMFVIPTFTQPSSEQEEDYAKKRLIVNSQHALFALLMLLYLACFLGVYLLEIFGDLGWFGIYFFYALMLVQMATIGVIAK